MGFQFVDLFALFCVQNSKTMTTVIQMNAAEMDGSFVEAVKSLFKDRTITISIEATDDLTETLNKHVSTREQLTEAMNASRNGQVVAVELDDLFHKIEQGVSFEEFMRK